MEQEILIIYPSGKKQDADLIKGGLYIPKRGGPIRIFQSIEEATKTGCIVYDRRAYCVRCGDETHFLEGKNHCPTCNHAVVAVPKVYRPNQPTP